MSYHGQKLIRQIKDIVNSQNLELINNELQYIRDTNQMQKSIDIICSLINIVGNYLVTAEKQNRPDDFAVFDTFCCLDFMSQFLELSNYDDYKINLQLIKTLSFLLINIKNKPSLYYLCSNNLLNKIISKDYSKYDDEFLSYYVNFLKSLSLLLDETSIQLFYIEKNNSFPLVENIIKFYNHKDSMIRNVVRNTIMNILRVKNCKIEDHFSKLPALLYFVKIVFHIKDYCLQIKEEIKNKNNKKLSYLFDDLYDELIYIDDLLNLKIEKINYILINSLFFFFHFTGSMRKYLQ
jgi:protein CLEC16A